MRKSTTRSLALLSVSKLIYSRKMLIKHFSGIPKTPLENNALDELDIAFYKAIQAILNKDDICTPHDFTKEESNN